MRDFTDKLVDLILENERGRIDGIMREVTKKVSIDFANAMFRFLDAYYDNYDPTSYVRIYRKKGKYMSGRTPRGGQLSLHAAVTRGGAENGNIAKDEGALKPGQVSYVGGIEFDESNFTTRDMYHYRKGIDEWDIVENFLYAGEGVGKGDWRSVIDYAAPSPDELMRGYMDKYNPIFDKHYKDALNKSL